MIRASFARLAAILSAAGSDSAGGTFAAQPGAYFSEDRFHPSSIGYRRAAEVILPTLLRAVAVEQTWTEVVLETPSP